MRVQRLLLYALILYGILLLGPIAGFDLPKIGQAVGANPKQLLQFLLIGLANGAILAVIALGYTMVYGIIELINFAHGDVFMLGSFMALTVVAALSTTDQSSSLQIWITLILALIFAVLLTGGVNVAIERLAYRPLRNAPRLAALISAIGVSFTVENIGLIWAGQGWIPFLKPVLGTSGGAAQKAFPDLLPKAELLQGLGIRFTTKDLFVIAAAGLLTLGLEYFVHNTRLGKAMRATAQNRDAARIMGIDIDAVIAVTFLIGGSLAGAAGLLFGLYNNTVWWFMGFSAGLRAFTSAVLGGIGNITGAVLGGVVIGLLASFSDGYLDTRWTNAWVFAILVLILVFRPTGLLGEHVTEKA